MLNNIGYNLNLENIDLIIYIIKLFFICICTYYSFLRIINNKNFINKSLILILTFLFITSIICGIIKYSFESTTSNLILILLLSSIFSFATKIKFGNAILISTISLSINYVIFFISVLVNFIPNGLLRINNHFINLFFIILIYTIFLYLFFKIKKFKNGFSFINKRITSEYFDILILNISIILLFIFTISSNVNWYIVLKLSSAFIIFSIIAFITIRKTFAMYYKHKLLVSELNDTKFEIEKKNKEIADLEAENLEYSKTAHSIAHKQKSLEHKLNKLMLKTEFSEESDLRDRLEDISNQFSKVIATTPIPKTEIEIIDDMISCMASECKENNIDFELQLNGNIHHMINNIVSKEEIEILLADHIKDAIIAIKNSDNVNKSILVKLGLFDGDYLLSIYDSGIEFKIDTLLTLGLKPSTTYSNSGGTGMGFMNTFDTLRKYKASLYINEITKPIKDNYTKAVIICFNNKNEYKITSYRSNEIKETNNRDDLIIE